MGAYAGAVRRRVMQGTCRSPASLSTRSLGIKSCHRSPKIRRRDTVLKEFNLRLSSPVRIQIPQEYSKNERTSERATDNRLFCTSVGSATHLHSENSPYSRLVLSVD